MGLNMSVQQFVERLDDLNRYLLYYLEEIPKQLDQDEIIDILDQAKARNPTTELVVSLIINNEEHLHRVLADTGASSSIILEAYNPAPFIKIDDGNTTTWITMGGRFNTTKTGIFL
jgi:6-pyruvoyl-tetrahydropterin synthase